MKTAVSLPDEVFASADDLARRLGLSRSALYATAVAEYVAKHRTTEVTARLDDVYEREGHGVPWDVRAAQARAVRAASARSEPHRDEPASTVAPDAEGW